MSESPLFIVTGAAGFIGRNVAAALNAEGYTNLLLVDRLGTDEKWKNLRGLVYEDFLDIDDFRTRIRTGRIPAARAVFHLGACSATTERDADYLMDNNYQTTRELCLWSLEHGARFIYASSAATYGDGEMGYSDADEKTPHYIPLNMYGYSKHQFDLWALQNGLLDQIVGLKYFNVYGPYEDHKGDMRSVVHKAYAQVRNEGRVNLFKSYRPDYADGEQVRDFIYVKDAVAVTLWFERHREVSGLYNCGTGQSRSWKDLAQAVFSAVGVEPNIGLIEMPESLRPKYQYFTESDDRKLRAAGYDRSFASLEEGVKDYVESHLAPTWGSHPDNPEKG